MNSTRDPLPCFPEKKAIVDEDVEQQGVWPERSLEGRGFMEVSDVPGAGGGRILGSPSYDYEWAFRTWMPADICGRSNIYGHGRCWLQPGIVDVVRYKSDLNCY